MKLLVTGGAGDIGTTVVTEIREQHDVTILDRRASTHHPDLPFIKIDLENASETASVVQGFDVVVHLAAIPDPFSDPDDVVFRLNCLSTFNLLEAVRAHGIRRIVFGCSESASGLGIHNRLYQPEYLPIDEEHPSWPHEGYSLSKYFGEVMCEEYSRAYDIEGISLRYAWVWGGARNQDQWMQLLAQEADTGGEKDWLGAWIAVEDVAQGIRLACDFQFTDQAPRFERFYLTARDNFTGNDTLHLVHERWPNQPPPIRKPELYVDNPKASVFDYSKATQMLGYTPSVNADALRDKFGIPRR